MDDLVLAPDPDPPLAADDPGLVSTLVRRRFRSEQGDAGRAEEAARAHLGRVQARLTRWAVADAADGRPRGHLWGQVSASGEDLTVVELVLDDHAVASAVRDRLVDRARGEGRRRLVVEHAPAETMLAALVEGPGASTVATVMALDLADGAPAREDEPAPGAPVVVLRPMGQAVYDAWWEQTVAAYAAELERAGLTADDAAGTSRRQHADLLPEGRETPDQHLLEGLVVGGAGGAGGDGGDGVVGHLWISTATSRAFGFDLVVHEHHRRRGLGEAFLRAGVRWARERGVHAVGLNVFGHNDAARRLYDRAGFRVVSDVRALDLSVAVAGAVAGAAR